MQAPEIYVTARKEVLLAALEHAVRQIRESDEGHISVQIYGNPVDGTINFTDEDTARDGQDEISIEVEG
jgi:hypothetical protein